MVCVSFEFSNLQTFLYREQAINETEGKSSAHFHEMILFLMCFMFYFSVPTSLFLSLLGNGMHLSWKKKTHNKKPNSNPSFSFLKGGEGEVSTRCCNTVVGWLWLSAKLPPSCSVPPSPPQQDWGRKRRTGRRQK